MKSKYTSGKSVGKNQTVPIGVDDPRLKPDKIGQTKARQGAEIDIVGLDGKALIMGGRGINNSSGITPYYPPLPPTFEIVIPRGGNKPPKTYPGGSGPVIIVPTDPTNVTAEWINNDLVISFDWDYANDLNDTVSQFVVQLTSGGVTKRSQSNIFLPNTTQTRQTITVTKSIITSMFNVFRTSFSAICVLTADPLNNISNTICVTSLPTYVLSLPLPVITVTSISNGYSVAYTTPTEDVYDAIDIWEIESTSTTAPAIEFAADGITPTNYKRSYFNNLNPANVITQNYNKRWVMARFSSDAGLYTLFCAAQAATPTSPVSVDNTPPNEVTQIQATWIGDNISISYKLPAQDPGSRIQIELTAPNNLVGFFYKFPDGSGRDQTTTITKKDLYDQFGEHYSSFSGILRSLDPYDNRTSGVSFNVDARANPLTGITPTFSVVALSNAYSVNFTLPTGAAFGEVYAKHTAWTSDPTDDTYLVYAGLSPAIIVDTDYTTVYIKIRYYDDFGNTSNYSAQGNTTPLNPGEITSFENPISFGTNAVIYAGNSATTGNRVTFKTSGIFAYDSTNSAPTTQIISNASSGTPTFITTQAQIADWNVTDTKIENTLSGTPTKYTGLSATGTYAFWAGSDTTGGDSSANFTVTPLGAVQAKNIQISGGTLDVGPSSPNGFHVNSSGVLTATGATIYGTLYATGGEFTGNVKLNGGSLYALGSGGTVSSGIRTIFNSSGVAAFNNAGGYAQLLTTPLADGSVFATTAANIGGWKVDSSAISKTGVNATSGNISLNSASGYISVSASNITGYTAGINGPFISTGSTPSDNINGTGVGTENVFWAGSGGATSTSNAFRVTLAGNLYASAAKITGTVSSVGALGTMTMDGEHGYMSLQTAGVGAPVSYLVPRNNNIYLTAPSTTAPWSTGKQISSSGPTNAPYISAGSEFKDYWNNTPVKGVGLYTGNWDYFTLGTSDPFITASTTGIQLSVSPSLGLLLDKGSTATGSKLNPAIPTGTASMLFYTAKKASADPVTGAPAYSPDTKYGAWASFTNNTIKLTADEFLFINIQGSETAADRKILMKATDLIAYQMNSDGIKIMIDDDTHQTFLNDKIKIQATNTIHQTIDSTGIKTQSTDTIWQQFTTSGIKTQSTASIWQEFTSTGIRLQSTNSVYQSFDSTSITLTSGKTTNTQSDLSAYGGGSKIVINDSKVSITGIPRAGTFDMGDYRGNPYYRGAYPLGYPPRQRMVIEDPVTGEAQLGMAVYYLDTAKINVTVKPDDSMGVQGDLAVWFS